MGFEAIAGRLGADPTLALYRGQQVEGAAGTTVRVDGVFPWNALLQSGYPLELVLWPADGVGEFLRIGLDGSVHRGDAAYVIDGLTPAEAVLLSSLGESDRAHGLAYVAEGRLDVRVTGAFAGRPLEAQLIVIDEGTPFVSNTIALEND